ncbi:hypothetical protein [Marinoscillum furvescens]|uniref:DUF4252 domain-containing protein n=1 Tax=Marinoscillum furvescens DSM 4134 TaxID=1122208 RepID=A0A3D9L4W9_MARFU|nr:hypothetical protein [Marinoscillum furvescens]RED99454.1 hypothetical protein C7460_10870 [Marinoscillum furvescens DSM 4134]
MSKLLYTGLLVILLGACKPSAAYESPIKELLQSDQVRTYAFYPSTLRMVNIANNDEIDSMASDINKLLIFRLDSTAIAKKKHLKIPDQYQSLGFEEYLTIDGGKARAALFGLSETRTSTLVGYWSATDETFAFYINGNIDWMKLPDIMEAFQDGEIANILSPN